MLRQAAAFALWISFALLALGQEPPVGKWESVGRSRGGLGAILELKPDGSAALTVAAMVDFQYKLDGNKLVTSFENPETGKREEQASEIRIEGDTLVRKQEGGEIRMKREGEERNAGAPIVGVWSYAHDSGGTAFETFTPDGRLIFRLPIRSDPGKWSVSGERLTVRIEREAGSAPRMISFRIEPGGLVTTDDKGKDQKYKRAE